MPIIGSLAGGSARGLGGMRTFTPASVPGDFESIQTASVTTGTAPYLEFTNIPSSYRHLQIRGVLRSNRALTQSSNGFQFNNDTAANYSFHQMYASDGTVGSEGYANQSQGRLGELPGSSAPAGVFGIVLMEIRDYKENKWKIVNEVGGSDRNTSGCFLGLNTSMWRNTVGITSIKVFEGDGSTGNYIVGSSLALYGIKG